jgi:hypothetical protein
MEWDKKLPSRLNRRRISKKAHLTGQVGPVGQAGSTRLISQAEGGLLAGIFYFRSRLKAPILVGLIVKIDYDCVI